MRLVLELPARWRVDGDRTAQAAAGDARVSWTALDLLPDEQRAWIGGLLRRDLPPGARVEIADDHTTQTALGWPLRLIDAVVVGDAGAPLEWRTVACYAFFEHAAAATLRAPTEPAHAAARDELAAAFSSGRPDWSGETACLHQLWDIADAADTAPAVAAPAAAPPSPTPPSATADLDAEVAALVAAGRHLAAGAALATRGREREAIAAWQRAAEADPADVDALYNIGLAHHALGEPAAALASWLAALDRAPRDFAVLRKVVQAEHALGRHAAAALTRARLLDAWRTATDPEVVAQTEFVFAQLELAGVAVHASETLRPRDPTAYPVYTFRVVDPRHRGRRLEVAVETSDYARARGTAFVLSVLDGDRYRAVGALDALPGYPELIAKVGALLADALARRA